MRLGWRPSALPVIGSAHIPSRLNRCCSVTAEPVSTPRPSSRPPRPAPKNTPGGVPDVGVVAGQVGGGTGAPSPTATDSIR